MFKSTSNNSQARERNSVVNDRSNHSVDPTTWKDLENSRLALLEKKAPIEHRLTDLKNCIGQFLIRGKHKYGSESDRQQFERWSNERARLISTLKQVDAEFAKLKSKQVEIKIQKEGELPVRFMRMAKLMLAEPIFERILVASLNDDEMPTD